MVSEVEDEDQDGNLIRVEDKQFPDSEEFPDGRDFKFNNLSQVSFSLAYNLCVYSGCAVCKKRKKNITELK